METKELSGCKAEIQINYDLTRTPKPKMKGGRWVNESKLNTLQQQK